ncbi:MAG: serine/threonine-protein phosphatase [Flavobacteriales bacterium]|nr:serine/threonine-protein phosphatase [Flavobacteriales bacterium]
MTSFTILLNKYESIGIIKDKSKGMQMAIKSFSWILFWTFIASIIWSILLYLIGQPSAIIFPVLAAITMATSVVIFYYNKNFSAHTNRYLFLLLVLPGGVQIVSGGFMNSGAVICWSVVAPLMALAFKRPKQARKCFFFFLTALIITAFVELYFKIDYVPMSREIVTLQFLMNFIGVMSLCFFPILDFSKELYRIRQKIQSNNRQIIQSINYAKYIQTATLHSKEQLSELLNQSSFLFFEPKDIVSGDFYWAHKNGDDIFLACADCTGHGVPGAFMTMIGINHLNSIVLENNEQDPSKILSLLHQRVTSSLKNANDIIHDGMDISICKINFKTARVEYASAMSKIFYFDGDKIISCPVDKCSIGDSRRKISYKNHVLQLKEGQSIYLATDGYIDQFGGPNDKKFGTRQLTRLLGELKDKSLKEQENFIQSSFTSWKGDKEQIDDVTLIGIHF